MAIGAAGLSPVRLVRVPLAIGAGAGRRGGLALGLGRAGRPPRGAATASTRSSRRTSPPTCAPAPSSRSCPSSPSTPRQVGPGRLAPRPHLATAPIPPRPTLALAGRGRLVPVGAGRGDAARAGGGRAPPRGGARRGVPARRLRAGAAGPRAGDHPLRQERAVRLHQGRLQRRAAWSAPRRAGAGPSAQRLAAEVALHRRIASPLAVIAFALMAVPIAAMRRGRAGRRHRRRGGRRAGPLPPPARRRGPGRARRPARRRWLMHLSTVVLVAVGLWLVWLLGAQGTGGGPVILGRYLAWKAFLAFAGGAGRRGGHLPGGRLRRQRPRHPGARLGAGGAGALRQQAGGGGLPDGPGRHAAGRRRRHQRPAPDPRVDGAPLGRPGALAGGAAHGGGGPPGGGVASAGSRTRSGVRAAQRAEEISATRFRRGGSYRRWLAWQEPKRWFRGADGRHVYHLRGALPGGGFEHVTVLRGHRRTSASSGASTPAGWSRRRAAPGGWPRWRSGSSAPDGLAGYDRAGERVVRFDEPPGAFDLQPGRPSQLAYAGALRAGRAAPQARAALRRVRAGAGQPAGLPALRGAGRAPGGGAGAAPQPARPRLGLAPRGGRPLPGALGRPGRRPWRWGSPAASAARRWPPGRPTSSSWPSAPSPCAASA